MTGDLQSRIDALEKEKSAYIDRLRRLNGKKHYKEMELKAMLPFLEQTKDVRTGFLRKQKRAIEFKIQTAAYTPKLEREWLKELKVVENELDKVKEVERARRKKQFIEQDILEATKEIETIEPKLKGLRDELKKLYDERKMVSSMQKRGIQMGGFNDEITLGDIGIIEEEDTKKPK